MKITRGKKTFSKGDKIIHFPIRLTEKFHSLITQTAEDLQISKHKLILDAIKKYIKEIYAGTN